MPLQYSQELCIDWLHPATRAQSDINHTAQLHFLCVQQSTTSPALHDSSLSLNSNKQTLCLDNDKHHSEPLWHFWRCYTSLLSYLLTYLQTNLFASAFNISSLCASTSDLFTIILGII